MGWAVLSAVLGTAAYGQGAGHRVTANQVVVNGASHWRNWTFPQGVVEISPSGALTPHQLHRDIKRGNRTSPLICKPAHPME